MTVESIKSVVATVRARLAARGAERRARHTLEQEIAQFRTPTEREELSAILDQHPGPDADAIRHLLRTA